MSAADYSWHQEPWRVARAAVRRGAHALLVGGPRGVGKRQFALKLANDYLCETRRDEGAACGSCESCRWFVAGTHPDFVLVEPFREDAPEAEAVARNAAGAREHLINVDQVRRIGESLALSSHRQSGKVVVIHPAEAMNVAAANALLKNLEEPPPRTLFLLVSHRPALLAPTVRSRCQHLHIEVSDLQGAERWLSAQGIGNAALYLALCGGAPLAALEAAADPLQIRRPELLRNLCEHGADGVALAEQFRDLPPVAMLSWLQKWTFDVLHARYCDRARYHLDLSEVTRSIAGDIDPHALGRLHRRLLALQRHIHHPLNPRLLIEQILIDCRQVLAGPQRGTI